MLHTHADAQELVDLSAEGEIDGAQGLALGEPSAAARDYPLHFLHYNASVTRTVVRKPMTLPCNG